MFEKYPIHYVLAIHKATDDIRSIFSLFDTSREIYISKKHIYYLIMQNSFIQKWFFIFYNKKIATIYKYL